MIHGSVFPLQLCQVTCALVTMQLYMLDLWRQKNMYKHILCLLHLPHVLHFHTGSVENEDLHVLEPKPPIQKRQMKTLKTKTKTLKKENEDPEHKSEDP